MAAPALAMPLLCGCECLTAAREENNLRIGQEMHAFVATVGCACGGAIVGKVN